MSRLTFRDRPRLAGVRGLKAIFLLLSACGLAFVGWMVWFALSPVSLASSPLEFSIRQGSGLRGAVHQIQDAGVAVLARANGAQGRIKAGSYQVVSGLTPLQLLRKITQGEFAQAEVVLIEGWTFRQMRAELDIHPDLRHDSANLTDVQIMEHLGNPGVPAEGMFFPDTYVFSKGESDFAVLARAQRVMQKRLEAAWARREPQLPVQTQYEALILASIVEKETGVATDRGMVAAVFANRLKMGMRLQTDPTVIYGLGDKFDGNLRKRDLTSDTPFNTYTRMGLPPHPIAMPGAASIEAVMHPAKSDVLYFVSRGDGSSEFSRSLADHNRAVNKYQKSGGR